MVVACAASPVGGQRAGALGTLEDTGGGRCADIARRASTTTGARPAIAIEFSGLTACPRSINNVLGSRLTLLLGTTGYSLYIGSYL